MKPMSRQSRLREYAKPTREANWCGESSESSIDRWSQRAHEESDGHRHRAKSGKMELPSTGEMKLHDTAAPRVADPRKVAKADLNHEGSSYMKSIRRNA
jgi:hypothetical protein